MRAESNSPTDVSEATGGDASIQIVDRVAKVLKALANSPQNGLTFTDVGRETELGKGTTHRLLKALVHAGLAQQDAESKQYRLGALVGLLGAGAMSQAYAAACRGALDELAEETGDTVFASTVEGYGAVCIARATGKFPIRTLVLSVGEWRPLGVGAGSIALLAAQPDSRITETLEHNATRLGVYPNCTADAIRGLVRKTRAQGYSFMTGQVVPGMSAVGMAIPDGSDRPACAISVAAINERMTPERVAQLAVSLRRHADDLSVKLGRLKD